MTLPADEHQHPDPDWDQVEITVVRRDDRVWIPNVLDDDGTPMYQGERLVEIRPGTWMHPYRLALMNYLGLDP